MRMPGQVVGTILLPVGALGADPEIGRWVVPLGSAADGTPVERGGGVGLLALADGVAE